LTRWASLVVTPSRTPESISWRLTQVSSVCGTQPIPRPRSYPQPEPAWLKNKRVSIGWKTRVSSPWNSTAVPLWHLVKKNGELLRYLPGGSSNQTPLLDNEKVPVEQAASGAKVKNLKAHLVRFEGGQSPANFSSGSGP
jgi:hypothetical protein